MILRQAGQGARMVSRTSLLGLVRAFDWKAIDAGLREKPDLIHVKDERQRNWLHILCATPLTGGRKAAASIRVADVLLARGIDVKEWAFTEGDWKSVPVWWCVAHGRNLALAEHLLKLGADPHYSMFAASWNDDVEAIDLLVKYGAPADDQKSASEPPLLWACSTGRFKAAQALLRHGANPQAKDNKGRTAFHKMLEKPHEPKSYEMLAKLGMRGDIPGPKGQTAAQIMARKKDERFRKLAEKLA